MAMENSNVSPSETEMRNLLDSIQSFGNKAISALVAHSDLARKYDELNSRFTAIEQDVNWYKSENEKNIAQVNTLVAEKNQLAERNHSMSTEIDGLYSEVGRLENELRIAKEAAADNLARCNTLSYDLSELQRDCSVQKDRERQLQETVAQLQDSNADKDITISSLRDANNRLSKERNDAQDAWITADNKAKEAEGKLADLRNRVADMSKFFNPPQAEPTTPEPEHPNWLRAQS